MLSDKTRGPMLVGAGLTGGQEAVPTSHSIGSMLCKQHHEEVEKPATSTSSTVFSKSKLVSPEQGNSCSVMFT